MKRRRSLRVRSVADVRPNLRRALWVIYGGKCAYTGADLPEKAFHVDHVVPKELSGPGRHREKLKVLRELGLPDDFDLFALTNLVPTTVEFNREKSLRIVPELIARGLKQAAEKADVVMTLYVQLEAIEGLEKEARDLGVRYCDRLDRRFVAEFTYKVIRGEPIHFEPCEELDEGYAVVATHNVYSTCYAPTFPDYAGSLLLYFKRVEVSGCGLTFGQRELMGLLRGMRTPAGAGSRGFIVGYNEKEDEYVVQLGNNRFSLTAKETSDLCAILDTLGAWYLSKLRRVEAEVLHSTGFERSEAGGYLLCSVDLDLWREIIRFASAHDMAKGETPWHIFDANPHHLKIHRRSEGDGHETYRAFIHPQMDLNVPPADRIRVWLRWDPSLFGALDKRETSFKFETLMDVAATYKWVVEELLPEVVRWSHADFTSGLSFTGRAVNRLLGGAPLPRAERSEGIEFIEADRVRRMSEFELVVEKLWSRSTGSRSAVPPAAGDEPHLFLAFLLDNCEPISEYLLKRTAGAFNSAPSVAGIKAAIELRRQEYMVKGVVSGWEVKSALDAVTLLLREGNLRCTSEHAMATGLKQLAGLIEEYNAGGYIDRFTGWR